MRTIADILGETSLDSLADRIVALSAKTLPDDNGACQCQGRPGSSATLRGAELKHQSSRDILRAKETDLSRLSVIRSRSEDKIRRAVNQAVDAMASEFLYAEPRGEAESAYNFLAILEEAEHDGYQRTAERLNRLEGVTESAEQLDAQANEFAAVRVPLVRDWHLRTWGRFERALQESQEAGETRRELWRRLREMADTVKAGSGNVVVETEAQAVYGLTQLTALTKAGYTSKLWLTVGDDKVRDTHASQDYEERPIDMPFSNGLQYPGDPDGGPEEVANCRCWLTGGEKAPIVELVEPPRESRQVRRYNERMAAKALRRVEREVMV